MHAFQVTDLQKNLRQNPQSYLEFLNVPSMSMGLYELSAGTNDPQQPHTEDEVYFVVSGQAIIRVADEDRSIGPGSIIFVAAKAKHYFHTITKDLSILVFFAPAEYSDT